MDKLLSTILIIEIFAGMYNFNNINIRNELNEINGIKKENQTLIKEELIKKQNPNNLKYNKYIGMQKGTEILEFLKLLKKEYEIKEVRKNLKLKEIQYKDLVINLEEETFEEILKNADKQIQEVDLSELHIVGFEYDSDFNIVKIKIFEKSKLE